MRNTRILFIVIALTFCFLFFSNCLANENASQGEGTLAWNTLPLLVRIIIMILMAIFVFISIIAVFDEYNCKNISPQKTNAFRNGFGGAIIGDNLSGKEIKQKYD
jgi:TRAP-type C4-dicarboxylate transport system permease small subunit